MATAIVLKREIIKSRLINNILGVSIFIVLTSLGAFVRIPLGFTPVPLTLQTFFVLLSGAILGPNLGLFSQAGYLLLGAAGLPIFSGAGTGLLYLFGPTAGYIWGFILASFMAGHLVNRTSKDRLNFWSIFLYMCLADLIILLCGSLWLYLGFKFSLRQALLLGFFPFIAGDIIKVIVAAHLYKNIQTRTKEIFS